VIGYRYSAELDRVVDGDTVDLWVDLGFRMWSHQRFRLAGLDAPEIRGIEKAQGARSKKWLLEALESANEIEVVSQKTGKYGRWLGILYADGVDINDDMVALGYAVEQDQ